MYKKLEFFSSTQLFPVLTVSRIEKKKACPKFYIEQMIDSKNLALQPLRNQNWPILLLCEFQKCRDELRDN